MSSEPPRRRHSPAVYRRRRILLVLVILAVAAVVWLLIAQPWSGAAAQSAPPSPSKTKATTSATPVLDTAVSPSPSATPEETPDAAAAPPADSEPLPSLTPSAKPCVAADVTVEPKSDLDTYAAGQNPQLSITLTNNGATDCSINVGTSSQAFTITSGSDVWWRSTDCQSEPSDMVVLLAAGQSVSSAAPLTWDRTRSAVGTCDASDRPTAPGGGASYHLDVEIGGIPSTQSTQLLLY